MAIRNFEIFQDGRQPPLELDNYVDMSLSCILYNRYGSASYASLNFLKRWPPSAILDFLTDL